MAQQNIATVVNYTQDIQDEVAMISNIPAAGSVGGF